MKILLIGNYANDRQESMQRMATLLFNGLRDAGLDAEVMTPPAFAGRLIASGSGLGKWLGYIDKFFVFPILLKRRIKQLKGRSLVVHICDHSNAFYTRVLSGVPNIVTCHDLLAIRSALGEVPQNQTGWSGKRLQSIILAGLNRARHVACVSNATRLDLLRLSTLGEEKVTVIPNALNHPYSPIPREEAQGRIDRLLEKNGLPPAALSGDFILHVGGNQWYKNRMGVLRIYALLREEPDSHTLVMVGKPFTVEMRDFVEANRLPCCAMTVCDGEDLRALYCRAQALLFPSLAEGFGWPIIEAQACGCPVVCSSGQPFLEVSGGAALMCEATDEQSFAVELLKLRHPEVRESLVRQGLENARRHDAASMIEAYRRRYSTLLAA
jgi:glycosyltransferase involved in cell wall biosynthesis